jgi:hypothetical protein
MKDKPLKKTNREQGLEINERYWDKYFAHLDEATKARIIALLKELNLSPKDPVWPILFSLTECRFSIAVLPELRNELVQNMTDFKASVYDVRREADRLSHLLQRKLGGIQQLPLSRAMWACGVAAFIGMVSGIAVMGGLFLFALHNDCNFETLDCPKLHLKSEP